MNRKRRTSLISAALLLAFVVTGIAATARANPSDNLRARVVEFYAEAPVSFEANQGQADARADFISHGNGYGLLLSAGETTLVDREDERVKLVRP
jgi:hypothetical protein